MMENPKIVVIGASAGGIPALQTLAARLPADLPAAVLVVMHMRDFEPSYLPAILDRAGPLPATRAVDGADLRPGRIYVAVPGHHLLVDQGRIGVKRGPKENRFRPSIDALFRSSAYVYRQNVIGVVLSGMLSDGTSGLWTIKQLGGTTIVQDPDEAEFHAMPNSALQEVDVDHVVRVDEMASLIGSLCAAVAKEPVSLAADLVERVRKEIDVAASDDAFNKGILDYGEPTPFTCPECHGILVRITEGRLVRYRCHTGHGFTANALLAGITKSVEELLWSTLRAMEEAVMLLDHMSHHFADLGRPEDAGLFKRKAKETRAKARVVQKEVTTSEHLSTDNRSAGTKGDGPT